MEQPSRCSELIRHISAFTYNENKHGCASQPADVPNHQQCKWFKKWLFMQPASIMISRWYTDIYSLFCKNTKGFYRSNSHHSSWREVLLKPCWPCVSAAMTLTRATLGHLPLHLYRYTWMTPPSWWFAVITDSSRKKRSCCVLYSVNLYLTEKIATCSEVSVAWRKWQWDEPTSINFLQILSNV